ncbi:phosphodiesterase [Gemmobacter aquarius]|uniref:Phosphodiesterase n=1 Tax=Paragemmobacter aquarius TaxID=2169400 RepID=A0A2S0UK21_9RHOB|nr:metallophosphoesterase [Gemmobacter aquarius]AWB48159.1 phosphodiesterase [Gemmobacter aquarius]
MRRIVHLSDPHFGAEEPRLVPHLLAAVAALAPDLVVMSGDLTQRARPEQFEAAARFLAACPAPVLAIAGNHDVPLYDLRLRFGDPWRRWRQSVGRDLEPVFENDALVVVAVNTANPLAWKDGKITGRQVERVARCFAEAGARRRVLVMHHPLQGPPAEPPALVGAGDALAGLVEAGTEVVLSGHLHATYVTPLTGAERILSVQAGTCLSWRVRGDGNAFNALDFDTDGVVLTHHRAGADGRFAADAAIRMERRASGWQV